MTQYTNDLVVVSREVDPINNGQGVQTAVRGSRRGEIYTQPVNDESYALEGAYGVFSCAVPGTGITSQSAITAYDATKRCLHIKNSETTKSLIVKYVKIFVGTVSGGSGTIKYEWHVDTASMLTSGGTALSVRRANVAVASLFGNVVITAGAMTTIAGNSVPLYSGQLRNGVGLAGDEFLFSFGGPMNVNGYLDPATTVGQQKTLAHGPLIVTPGGSAALSIYGASMSGACVFEWEVGTELH